MTTMLTYSQVEAEELEAEGNAQFDDVSERYRNEDGGPAFQRSEYESYLAELAYEDAEAARSAGVSVEAYQAARNAECHALNEAWDAKRAAAVLASGCPF